MKTIKTNYNRKNVSAGILHFGVGNFHRAHQEYYTNFLLEHPDQSGWGICGAMILEKDETVFRGLQKQDYRYGLTVCGRTGENEYHEIGSLVEVLWGIEDPAPIINRIADPSIRIITLTVTEGGYNIDKKTNLFDAANEDIQYDLNSPETPKTVFGYIAVGLLKRIENGAAPITILTCDNLPHNGDVCKKAFLSFFKLFDTALFDWAKDNVAFPNTMVDRITPATLPDDIERLEKMNGHADAVPVYCEDFTQWVIEDKFAAGRPEWDRVGVEFTNDVSTYEFMKLGVVNSTHLMLAFPAFLTGYRKVDEALADKRFEIYLKQHLDMNVTPYLTPPPNTDLEVYKKTYMERLKNPAISDQLARLCLDTSNRIPMFCMPTFSAMFNAGADMNLITFFLASYRLYLRRGTDDKGVPYKYDDPGLTENDLKLIADDDPLSFLGLECLSGANFISSEDFVKDYLDNCKSVEERGILSTIVELTGQ